MKWTQIAKDDATTLPSEHRPTLNQDTDAKTEWFQEPAGGLRELALDDIDAFAGVWWTYVPNPHALPEDDGLVPVRVAVVVAAAGDWSACGFANEDDNAVDAASEGVIGRPVSVSWVTARVRPPPVVEVAGEVE